VLAGVADELVLVDTKKQLEKRKTDRGASFTIAEAAETAAGEARLPITVLDSEDFAGRKMGLDVVFCIAVFDVVVREVRRGLTQAAYRNLDVSGHFVVIIPRNDSSILRRCTKENSYKDGHVFAHHGVETFFRNFRSTRTIESDCYAAGLTTVADLSRYRQCCLIFEK
jgi:hypothetical protein